MQDYLDIMQTLHKLTDDELVKLRQGVTALLSMRGAGGAAPADDTATPGKDVASLVNEVLSERGYTMLPHAQLAGYAKNYQTTAAELWAFARSGLPGGKRVEHLAILRLGVRMLCMNIEEQGIPLTHGVLMRQLDRLPPVMDYGFPGYAANGFLGLLVRSGLHAGSKP